MVRDLEGESVLLNLQNGQYFGLNEVGSRMWAVLAQSETIEAALQTLLAEYEVSPEELRADLEALILELEAARLILLQDVRQAARD